ncbi:hypothetical protein BT93_A0973 [Corymbia citriodora subsp. variegata]|nr:hypothetical protein BT93_A0973 [Corymbia citriodora subsp. variegata]
MQPRLFDGTTRLYISYICACAQRVWISRNYNLIHFYLGLQDKIKLVPLHLLDRPAWYKEKVCPVNKVPALEHDGKIIGESLDLIKYDPEKKSGEELWSYVDEFLKIVYTSFKGERPKESGSAFDHLESALGKLEDGLFFLGQFSGVDIAYIPFVERFQIFLSEVWKYDITGGRLKLAAWIEAWEELNKINAYKQTKIDPIVLVEHYKKCFTVMLLTQTQTRCHKLF